MKLILSVVSTLSIVISCRAKPEVKPTTPSLNELIKDVFKVDVDVSNVTIDNNNCECVPYYQCHNDTILENGVGLIDIRNLQNTCDSYMEVCCRPPDIKSSADKITPKPQTQPQGCGQRNPRGVGFRITGAHDGEAQFAEFPWTVAVLKEENNSTGHPVNVYQCGGSLIHYSVVLTAAHCVDGKPLSALRIRAGEWDTQTTNEIYPHQDREVEQLMIHEHFHPHALLNDFALIKLKKPFDPAENIGLVCLPEQYTNFDEARCFASGWGKDVFGKEGRYQVILKKVELPIVEHAKCQSLLRTTRLSKYFKLHESFVCAGGEPGKDTCKGDGGSPLVCPVPGDKDNRYYQAGIVAWGIGCGENQIPGVYGQVAYARRWIDENMRLWDLSTKGYQYKH